ncbi:MAG: glycosyltransferase [Vicinamibacterales bacterium]
MRILHVIPGVALTSGGPRNLIGLIGGLARHGVDTTLLTTNLGAATPADAPVNQSMLGDNASRVVYKVWATGGRYGLAPSLARTLRRTVGTYDLVHVHWLYNFSCIAAARAALAAGVPFVVQPHGSLDPHLRQKSRLVKYVYMATIGRPLLRKAAAVVFDTIEEGRLASYGPRRPELIVPTGLVRDEFDPLPPRGTFRAAFPTIDGPFLLFVGRLSAQKGLDLLLGAFKRLRYAHPNLWLVIAGPDFRGYEARVRDMAARLEVTDRVLFAGMLSHPLKLAAFVDAELFVLPSYAENFGTVIMEALLCGLPVVISDGVNTHRELQTAGVASVVRCSVDSVAAGVESVLADGGARERIATAGPAFVNAHYTWDAIVPHVVAAYEDVIARARRRTAHQS